MPLLLLLLFFFLLLLLLLSVWRVFAQFRKIVETERNKTLTCLNNTFCCQKSIFARKSFPFQNHTMYFVSFHLSFSLVLGISVFHFYLTAEKQIRTIYFVCILWLIWYSIRSTQPTELRDKREKKIGKLSWSTIIWDFRMSKVVSISVIDLSQSIVYIHHGRIEIKKWNVYIVVCCNTFQIGSK